jgi:NADPH-dependent 2,4-dienoyl-CoA reductase/sulfur reductase-like enzyme
VRSLRSSQRLRLAAEEAQQAVIIGAGFIGMEVTSVLTQRGVHCTVLEVGPRAWPRLVPEIAADFVQRYYQDQGADLRFGQKVRELRGDDRVREVALESGESLPADLVVVGVGAALNTKLAEAAGLAVDGGVVVDEHLRTSHTEVYAVGDVATFPDPIAGRIHVEHWDNALDQGRILGATLAGQPTRFEVVTQFFRNVFDLSFNLVGYPQDWEDIVVRGELEGGKLTHPPFRVIYVKDGTVRAVLLVNRRGELDMGELESWRAPAKTRALGDPTIDLRTLLPAGIQR